MKAKRLIFFNVVEFLPQLSFRRIKMFKKSRDRHKSINSRMDYKDFIVIGILL